MPNLEELFAYSREVVHPSNSPFAASEIPGWLRLERGEIHLFLTSRGQGGIREASLRCDAAAGRVFPRMSVPGTARRVRMRVRVSARSAELRRLPDGFRRDVCGVCAGESGGMYRSHPAAGCDSELRIWGRRGGRSALRGLADAAGDAAGDPPENP